MQPNIPEDSYELKIKQEEFLTKIDPYYLKQLQDFTEGKPS